MQKPSWIKVRYHDNPVIQQLKNDMRGLPTVCQESLCPNISECWSRGTATFMLMGNNCTRGCRFCSVKHAKLKPLDLLEAEKVLHSVKLMKLKYVVLTSVDRDDLPDQGAGHLAKCIKHLKQAGLKVEILIPDFRGSKDLLKMVVDAEPCVLAHNVETVERLTPTVRDRRAGYKQSLQVLKMAHDLNSNIITKSSIMLGLGETQEEIERTMDDLRSVNVQLLTIGQYLQPTAKQLSVTRYIPLEMFKYYERLGYLKGFSHVASGPFVRSSYLAERGEHESRNNRELLRQKNKHP